MIVERQVFYAKYGKGDALVNVFKRLPTIMSAAQLGFSEQRILTDMTGTMFRVIVELTWKDAASWQTAMPKVFAQPNFAAWFAEMEPLVDRGETELLNVVQ
ncbi:MAG: hypothetical protein HY875_10975 [Chloroflexi bacterium]|nr:hypothetical protein [Chloroflexota bacterium]